MQRIIFEMQERVQRMASAPDLSIASAWISKYLTLAQQHMITLDALQETILKEEIAKLHADNHRTKEFDSLIEELVMRSFY